jgi:hypothetical protein
MPNPAFLKAEADSLDRVPIHSSNVDSAAYVNNVRRLYVWYQVREGGEVVGTTVYCYLNVPVEFYLEMMTSESKGMFVYHKLRKTHPTGSGDCVKLGDGGPPVGSVKPYP